MDVVSIGINNNKTEMNTMNNKQSTAQSGEFESVLKEHGAYFSLYGVAFLFDKLRNAHNADMQTAQARIAELEAQLAEARLMLVKSLNREYNAFEPDSQSNFYYDLERVCAKLDRMKAMVGGYEKVMSRINKSCEAAGCRQGEDMTDFIAGLGIHPSELEPTPTIPPETSDDMSSLAGDGDA